VRETLEETGVRCSVDALAWVSVTGVVEYPNGDRSQYIDHTFRCTYDGGAAHPADDESTDVRWFPLDDLPPMPAHLRERVLTAASHQGPTRLS
jgi:8-oxo-dGTP pyrophosphatase MutT (NUDIX family)